MKTILAILALGGLGWFIYSSIFPSKRERDAKKRCSVCGSTIPYTARVCPRCGRNPGTDVRADAKVGGGGVLKSLKWALILIIGGALAIVLLQKLGIQIF